MRIPKYRIYHTKHLDKKAHGGTAIVIRESIKHYKRDKFSNEYLQASSDTIDEIHRAITMSAIYCPPKHNNKQIH